MIKLTENAKKRFQEQLQQRGTGLGIRLGVAKTGCNGYSYKIEFADENREQDLLSIHDNLYVWVTKDAYPYLDGLTIDYIKQGLNERFDFINPNETARCGCGESFTV
jgi:iron-sulfur cluster assembly protein